MGLRGWSTGSRVMGRSMGSETSRAEVGIMIIEEKDGGTGPNVCMGLPFLICRFSDSITWSCAFRSTYPFVIANVYSLFKNVALVVGGHVILKYTLLMLWN